MYMRLLTHLHETYMSNDFNPNQTHNSKNPRNELEDPLPKIDRKLNKHINTMPNLLNLYHAMGTPISYP